MSKSYSIGLRLAGSAALYSVLVSVFVALPSLLIAGDGLRSGLWLTVTISAGMFLLVVAIGTPIFLVLSRAGKERPALSK